MKPPRIVSLLPAATEAVFTFGLGDHLVGRSHECDYPPEAARVPVLTKPFVEPEATSAQIDQQVKARLASASPLCQLDLARLRELQPDVIITQNQCGVCAFDVKALEQSLAGWPRETPRLLSFNVRRFADLWTELRRLAGELGAGEASLITIRRLKERAADVVAKAAMVKRRPRILCLEWFDPLMASGNWIPDLAELAGGANCFTHAGEPSPPLKWEELVETDPDVILLMPCGLNLDRARIEAAVLTRHAVWPKLRAVRKRQVYLTDGNQFFNRPGPRLVESLEILAEILNPALFPFGWEKRGGWQKP